MALETGGGKWGKVGITIQHTKPKDLYSNIDKTALAVFRLKAFMLFCYKNGYFRRKWQIVSSRLFEVYRSLEQSYNIDCFSPKGGEQP